MEDSQLMGEMEQEEDSLFENPIDPVDPAQSQEEFTFNTSDVKSSSRTRIHPDLVRAYYSVGEQYQRAGKESKGSSFKSRAREMDPNFEPEELGDNAIILSSRDLAEEELGISEDELSSSPHNVQGADDEALLMRIVNFQFDRMVRGILSENLNVLSSLFAPSLEINDQELDHSDIMEALSYVFDSSNLTGLTFSDLYVSSPNISLEGNGGVVRVQAKEQASLNTLPFWKKNQELHFEKQEDGKWFLTKIIAVD